MNNDIRILAWNPNGLLQHQQELQILLDIQKIEICLISETHFTKQSHIKFKGYQVYHTIHPDNTPRGGSAIIVKSNIQHYEEKKYERKEVQATTISIKTKNQSFTVTALYCPPR
jgi:exonuclease III